MQGGVVAGKRLCAVVDEKVAEDVREQRSEQESTQGQDDGQRGTRNVAQPAAECGCRTSWIWVVHWQSFNTQPPEDDEGEAVKGHEEEGLDRVVVFVAFVREYQVFRWLLQP